MTAAFPVDEFGFTHCTGPREILVERDDMHPGVQVKARHPNTSVSVAMELSVEELRRFVTAAQAFLDQEVVGVDS